MLQTEHQKVLSSRGGLAAVHDPRTRGANVLPILARWNPTCSDQSNRRTPVLPTWGLHRMSAARTRAVSFGPLGFLHLAMRSVALGQDTTLLL